MKYIITGGPCTGKTTLLKDLAKKGYKTIDECAREIIDEEISKEGILPWTDLSAFQYMVMERQTKKEKRIDGRNPVFLDRGLPDNIAYCELGDICPPQGIYGKIKRADYKKAFILDRLPTYETDSARREGIEEAIKIHEKLCNVYERLGLDIINVPVLQREERRDYILEQIGED